MQDTNSILKNEYERVLKGINPSAFDFKNDKYSGVFLPFIFDNYETAKIKVMLVGRETAGWNTDNKKNTIDRIITANKSLTTNEIINEAFHKYKSHIKTNKNGSFITKSKSRFKQFYFRLAKDLGLSPDQLIYSNIFAWDYNKKTPLSRKGVEFEEICNISKELLAIQIKTLRPDVIVFATGRNHIDDIIKDLFNTHLAGYTTTSVVKGRLWEFKGAEAHCFRIAHPRATHGHSQYKTKVIEAIKNIKKT